MKRVVAALLGAGLLLAGCGQNTPTATSTDPYADGIDHSWTASTAEGQQIYGALSQGLKSQDFNIGLSITATNGWGPIELNTSNGEFRAGDGKPITLNGQVYSTGLGVHADSEIHIQATGLVTPACTRFQADVGIDDEIGDQGSVVFQVFADGEKVFDSGVMTGASATQHIDVAIGNKSDLRFVVTNAGDGYSYDHADWAGAAINCATQGTPNVTLDTSRLDIYHLNNGILHATFNNYPRGKVQLSLAADPNPQPDPGDPYTSQTPDVFPLVLKTVEVDLSGAASETKDIVIAAPTKPTSYASSSKFVLTTSASGVASQTLPVTLHELPINFKADFEPENLVGRQGDTLNTVLVVTADPPLDSAQTLGLQLAPDFGYSGPQFFTINVVGPSTGTGAEMRLPVTVKFNYSPTPSSPYVNETRVGVAIGNITTGYRDTLYGPNPMAPLSLTFNP